MFNLKTKIIKKFDLFEDRRDKQEDQKIFDKVHSLALDEVGRFIEENLPKDKAKEITEKLESVDSEDLDETKNIFLQIENELEKVPFAKVKLDKRLNTFINNLHYQILKVKKN